MQPANLLHFLFLFLRIRRLSAKRDIRFVRITQIVTRLQFALLMVVLSLGIGTAGFVFIENYPLLDAWYMSVITLASVGFGEIHPLSNAGRLFTSFLILFNVGLFAYSISTIIGIFTEGGLARLMSDYQMDQQIKKLSGHTIVCGFGRHATEVAQELAKHQIPFVVIENHLGKAEKIREETGYLFIEGDATQDNVLEAAGIERAAALVATLPSDADNLFIVISARQMNPSLRIISRAINEADEPKLRRAGADHAVVPERIGGYYMATLVDKPDLVRFFTLLSNMGSGKIEFEELPVSRLLPDFQGKTIENSGLIQAGQLPVIAIRPFGGQYQINPAPETVLQPDSHIVVLGNPEQMAGFRKQVLAQN